MLYFIYILMTKGSVKMTNQQIDFLLNIGYNMAQVSQLIKLQNDGFSVDVASDLIVQTENLCI
jgi:CRISPR/Cas system-associated protein endoribonuclease Cas2